MKIALFGASGMIGQRVLHEAVQRGHIVTAVARDPSKITETHPNIRPVKADLLDPKVVATVVAGHDAVVSAFSPSGGQSMDSLVASARSLIAGLKQAGVKRLIVVGGAGSLAVAPGLKLIDAPAFPAAYKEVAKAHSQMLDVMRAEANDLDWTNFSPAAIIEPGTRTGKFRLDTDNLVADAQGNSRISAEDYAVALVDELEKPKYIKKRFTAGY